MGKEIMKIFKLLGASILFITLTSVSSFVTSAENTTQNTVQANSAQASTQKNYNQKDYSEKDIVIERKKGSKIQEYRVNGRLYAIKITPKGGKPYYLADSEGSGNYKPIEEADLLIPKWVIFEWGSSRRVKSTASAQ